MSQAYEPAPAPMPHQGSVFPADPNAVPTTGPPTNSKNGRCLLFGCVGVFVAGLMLILCAGFGTYFTIRKQVEKYTSTEPTDIPTVEYSDERLAELESRIEGFQSNFSNGADGQDSTVVEEVDEPTTEVADPNVTVAEDAPPSVKELVLSANDINALISSEESLRGRLFVKIADGKVTGDISIPVSSFVPGSGGRYFNGSASFDVRLDDGILFVTVESAEIKGEPIPESLMQSIRKENLAKEVYKNEANAKMIRKFESIRVEDDKIIAKLRD